MSASPLFDAAFRVVVGIEKGYVNDPADPGGETKYGISKRAYPELDIASLTLGDAQGIYFKDYWTPAGCEGLPWKSALCLFDCAVNQGLSAAKSLWVASNSDVIDFMARRAVRYAENRNFSLYGHGWNRRLFTIFNEAQVSP